MVASSPAINDYFPFSGEIMKSFSLFFLVVLFALSGCTGPQPKTTQSTDKSVDPIPLPSTYIGRIPCPDCDGIDIVLNFKKNGLYQLRKTTIKGKTWDSVAEIGRWKYDRTEKLIVLGNKRGSLKTLQLVDRDTLRLQDVEGKKLTAKQNYELHRNPTPDPFPDSVRMRGMYSAHGDKGFFTECTTGIRFPVTTEKAYRELANAYNNTPHGQEEQLLVLLEGSLQPGPTTNDEGENGTEKLVVTRFLNIFPGQDCRGDHRRMSLFNTTWKLLEINGKPVTLADGQEEPYVILDIKGNRMHGFSGCNRFFGTYLIKGEIFVFNKMAATRMACMKGLSLEDAFLEAMHKTEAYRLQDGILELRDRDEHILARLQAAK